MAISPISKNLTFEEIFPWFDIKGNVTLCEGSSTAGFPEGTVARVIQKDQPVTVEFKWTFDGLLVPFLAGTWKGSLFFEQMGKEEFDLSPSEVSTPFMPINPTTEVMTLTIPENTIRVGVYKVVASLTFASPAGIPGPIAAFAELGVVQVYDA